MPFIVVAPSRHLLKFTFFSDLLEGLLESIPYEKKNSEVVENIFLFAVMWAFGGPMVVDKGGDFRKLFSEQFATTFGQKFPKERPCFDYVWSCQDDCFVECKSRPFQLVFHA